MRDTVLIVDDEKENIIYTIKLLTEMGLGENILSAPNGRVAFSIAKKKKPDLILTDWEMPEMNGIELVAALKSEARTAGIPVIMMTGKRIEAAHLQLSFEAGVHDYLRKPFNELEFAARVKNTLNLRKAFLTIQKGKEENALQAQKIAQQHKELQHFNSLQNRVMSIITYGLRLPKKNLTKIISSLNQASFLVSPAVRKHYLKTEHQLEETVSFLDNLLFWAADQIDLNQPNKVVIPIDEIIEESILQFQDRIDKNNTRIHHQKNEAINVYGHRHIISFIVKNLIDNTLRLTPFNGEISIKTFRTKEMSTVNISYSGWGLKQEQIQSILKNPNEHLVFRDNIEQNKIEFMLKICKDFALLEEGMLALASDLGKASIFSFTMPHNYN